MVDLGGQMTDLLIANRAYQANLRTVESAREAYQSALRLGGH
jgi:flagellar basal-body rod protein FlgC